MNIAWAHSWAEVGIAPEPPQPDVDCESVTYEDHKDSSKCWGTSCMHEAMDKTKITCPPSTSWLGPRSPKHGWARAQNHKACTAKARKGAIGPPELYQEWRKAPQKKRKKKKNIYSKQLQFITKNRKTKFSRLRMQASKLPNYFNTWAAKHLLQGTSQPGKTDCVLTEESKLHHYPSLSLFISKSVSELKAPGAPNRLIQAPQEMSSQ